MKEVLLPFVRRTLILLVIIENGKWRIENERHFPSLHSEKF
ncbi:hypothetical protein [Clostridium cochlearium]|nr:hypothetical protein [Clostridium cochlearium]